MTETICTKEKPNKDARKHPDAKLIGSTDSWFSDVGSYDTYKCPHCGLIFEVTIPD